MPRVENDDLIAKLMILWKEKRALQDQLRWRKVEEKPEVGKRYWVKTKNMGFGCALYSHKGYWLKEDITHWLPIPPLEDE